MTEKITDISQLDFKTLLDVYEGIMHPQDLKADGLWQVRLFDGMGGTWTDIGGAVQPVEALREWFRRTESGEKNWKFDDIDYYRIFPANTQMKWGGGREMFRGDEAMPEPEPVVLVEKKKHKPPWRFELALQFVQALERGLASIGWHIGMTGSVLHKGESRHDLDVIIYPHTKDKFDRDDVRKVLEAYGMKRLYTCEEVHAGWAKRGSKDTKFLEVWAWHHYRIDVFFLQ